jgi:hypothetical protein
VDEDQRGPYVALDDAAKELGISRALLWRLVKQRGITRYKQPGERRSLMKRVDMVGLREPVPISDRDDNAGKMKAAA